MSALRGLRKARLGIALPLLGLMMLVAGSPACSNAGTRADDEGGTPEDAAIPRTATVSGTLDAAALDTTNAFALIYTAVGDAAASSTLVLTISDRGATCGDYQKRMLANTSELEFTVLTHAQTLIPIGSGTTWQIGDNAPDGAVDDAGHRPFEFAQLSYTTSGSDCIVKSFVQGDSGTLTLTLVTPTRVKGTFDVVMKTGDHLTGTFDAPACVEETLGPPPGQPSTQTECVP